MEVTLWVQQKFVISPESRKVLVECLEQVLLELENRKVLDVVRALYFDGVGEMQDVQNVMRSAVSKASETQSLSDRDREFLSVLKRQGGDALLLTMRVWVPLLDEAFANALCKGLFDRNGGAVANALKETLSEGKKG